MAERGTDALTAQRGSCMRAVQLLGHGGTEMLRYTEMAPRPEPGRGEVLIKVGACGVNQTDVNTRTAWYAEEPGGEAPAGWSGAPVRFPVIQGSSIVGRVVGIGIGADDALIGRRVVVDPLILPVSGTSEPVAFMGSERDGGYADYVAVPERSVVVVESESNDVDVAATQTTYTTAESLMLRGEVQTGETILITGATGGVGAALIELAKLRGCRTVAAVRPGKLCSARELGADMVVVRNEDGSYELPPSIPPIDVVADVVGGAGFQQLVDAVRNGGRIVVAGAVDGPVAAIDLRSIIYRDIDIRGVGGLEGANGVRRVVDLLNAGRLRPRIAAVFPLRGVAAAQEMLSARRHVGRIVIDVEGSDARTLPVDALSSSGLPFR